MPEAKPDEVFRNLSAVEEAEQRAYRRGRETADLNNKLETHFKDDDRRFDEIKADQGQTTETLKTVVVKVDALGNKVDTAAAVTTARAEDAKLRAEEAKDVAEKQVSSKQFFIGLASLAVGILAALAASGHL